jgi:ribosomal protein L23
MEFTLIPKVTEKSISQAEEQNVYTFVLYRASAPVNKKHVAAYVEENYDVEVENVNTQIKAGRPKRWGRMRDEYRTKDQKVFYVKIKKGDSIPGFNFTESEEN